MSKTRRCTGCELPTADFIIFQERRLPYHADCALEAERDLRAIRDGIVEALVDRLRDRGPASGPLPRADEI
jgi:hypothetical protein